MDFAKALTFPFDDEEWLQKLGIGVGITLGGAILSFLIIPALLMLVLYTGWRFEIMKRVRSNDPTPLPGWDDFGGLLKKGITIIGAQIVYQIPTILFACLASGIWLLPALGAGNEDAMAALAGTASIIVACCSCLIVLYAIVAAVVFWGGLIRFVDREEFGTFMQFGDNIALVRENLGDFGMALLFLIGGGVISSVLSSIVIGGLLVPTFNSYFGGHVLGQLAKKVSGSEVAPAV